MIVTNDAALHFFRHRFAHLVAKDESCLIRKAQVTAEGQHALALHLVTEDRDSGQIAAQGQLVRGEQRAARDAEILFASLAAIAERNVRNKLSRGAFTAAYLIQCLEAVGVKELRL